MQRNELPQFCTYSEVTQTGIPLYTAPEDGKTARLSFSPRINTHPLASVKAVRKQERWSKRKISAGDVFSDKI